MKPSGSISRLAVCLVAVLTASTAIMVGSLAGRAAEPAVVFMDQGETWTPDLRAVFYRQDQGSQLILLSWLKALKQDDGKPFLDGSMARYGFLPDDGDPAKADDLPIGFSKMDAKADMMAGGHDAMVGVGCATCHVRELTVEGKRYRVDGGPANADFERFLGDLDAAVRRALANEAAFKNFAEAVLGPRATDPTSTDILHSDVELWSVRYHAFIEGSLPKDRPYGPSRLDAISLIYNRVAALDLGAAPTFLVPKSMEIGNAPSRYPFLWNSSIQDFSEWAGFAENGNDFYAMTRNLGQTYGVFGTLHPQSARASAALFKRNMVVTNSANFAGLTVNENLVKRIGPPVWPWPVDRALAEKGKEIYDRPIAAGGCVDCHGIAKGIPRPPVVDTWRTPIQDVGTDRREWQITFLREAETRAMAGSIVPLTTGPLKPYDKIVHLLRSAVVGAILENEVGPAMQKTLDAEHQSLDGRSRGVVVDSLKLTLARFQAGIKARWNAWRGVFPPLVTNGYEAKVLRGVWAAAPYLHNGSVPTLADLLEPADKRPHDFKLGPAYDLTKVGLATTQPGDFTLHTTGCDEVATGDSRCGHEYGTSLAADEKKALLEYLKVL